MTTPSWQSIRDRKLEQQASRIPREWLILSEHLPPDSVSSIIGLPGRSGILSKREIRITEGYTALGLVAAIRGTEFTAVEVTRAYCKVYLFLLIFRELFLLTY